MKIKLRYAIAAAVLVFVAGMPATSQTPDFKLGRNIEILVNMMRDVSLFYVDEVDPDSILKDAAEGMTLRLDPYTEYISADDMADFEIMTTGKYGGIGSLIRKKGDWIVIAQPYRNSPADKAGLRIGDRITEINGVSAIGYEAAKVSSLLKGDPGSTVKIKVEKLVSGDTEEVTIKRERIVIPGVPYYGFVGDGIGYIQHGDFSEDSADEVRRALMDLKKGGELKGLILDYRGNGGGILQEAVKVLSLFVPKGTEVVSMMGKTMEKPVSFRTESEPVDTELPIVVLMNSGSASAAEIVSGALQDLDRAVLMGQRTFGKGLVQATRPLGYNSYLKVTTAKYYIPSGRCIQAIDYAHRNEDGSVAFVPDSLVMEYGTACGRKVYDGGGVVPDVKLDPEYIGRFTVITYGKGYIDDFVDQYVKTNRQPVDLTTFVFTDSDYDEFIRFMEDKDVEYESETKAALDALKTKAQRERYYDKIKDELAEVENRIKDDKLSSLNLYRDQLKEIIEGNIVLRYHYSDGVTAHRLPKDKEVVEAAALLADRSRYKSILASMDLTKK